MVVIYNLVTHGVLRWPPRDRGRMILSLRYFPQYQRSRDLRRPSSGASPRTHSRSLAMQATRKNRRSCSAKRRRPQPYRSSRSSLTRGLGVAGHPVHELPAHDRRKGVPDLRVHEVLGLSAIGIDQPHRLRVGGRRAVGVETAVGEPVRVRLSSVFRAPVVAPNASLRLPAPTRRPGRNWNVPPPTPSRRRPYSRRTQSARSARPSTCRSPAAAGKSCRAAP